MASKQFIPGRPPIQKHQRIHFLLLNPDYIVEIFVSRILVAPLAQPPLFNGVLAKRKTTPRGRVRRSFECLGKTYFIRVHQIISVSASIANETSFVCAYLRYSSFFLMSQRCRAVSSQRFRPWNWKLSLVFLHRFHEINLLSWYISDIYINRHLSSNRNNVLQG